MSQAQCVRSICSVASQRRHRSGVQHQLCHLLTFIMIASKCAHDTACVCTVLCKSVLGSVVLSCFTPCNIQTDTHARPQTDMHVSMASPAEQSVPFSSDLRSACDTSAVGTHRNCRAPLFWHCAHACKGHHQHSTMTGYHSTRHAGIMELCEHT